MVDESVPLPAEISVDDLRKKMIDVELVVKVKQYKDTGIADKDSYFIVEYQGQCKGVEIVEGQECLLLEITQGRRELIGIIIETIEDISLYRQPPIRQINFAGFERNPMTQGARTSKK